MKETYVLHLSDLHIGKNGKAKGLNTVVGLVLEHYEPGKTIILITGDITEHGQKKQFRLARKILEPLYAKFEVLCVPGNHDYGYLGNHAEKRRFKHFKRFLFGPFENVSYPHIKLFNEHIFIGLNSMKGELGELDSFWADGEIGAKQLKSLDGVLGRIEDLHQPWRKVFVYLHHHPFFFADNDLRRKIFEKLFFELKDGEKLMQICAGRIDALLFGHKHNHISFCETSLCQDWNIPVILSCTQSSDRDTEDVIKEKPAKKSCLRNRELTWERENGEKGLLGHLIIIPDDSDMPLKTKTVVF